MSNNDEIKDEENTTNGDVKMTTDEDINKDMEITTPVKKSKSTTMTLFDSTEVSEQPPESRELKDIPLDSIKVSRLNVRVTDANKEVEILAQDMRRHGLRQPIEVRRVSGTDKELFDVVAGQRRMLAARMLGWKTIKAFVLSESLPENDRLLSLSENINRVDIDPKDRAMAVLELLEEHNGDWVLLSEILNRSVATLNYWVTFCKIPEKIQVMVSGKDGKKLGDGYARKLARYSEVEPAEMVKIAETIVAAPYQDKHRKDAIIAAIKENPKITAEEIEEKLEEREEDLAISIIFKSKIAKIIKKEGERRFEEPTQFIKSVIREYLETRGLLKQMEDMKKKKKGKAEEEIQNDIQIEKKDEDETNKDETLTEIQQE